MSKATLALVSRESERSIFGKTWEPSTRDQFQSQDFANLKWNMGKVQGELSQRLFAVYNGVRKEFEKLNGEPWNSDFPDLDNPEKLDSLRQEIKRLKDAIKRLKGITIVYV